MNAHAHPNLLQPLTPDNHPDWIVVDDPNGAYSEGSLIDAARRAQLKARGVETLPVIPNLFRQSGVGGFFKRGWGSGYPLSADVPKLHCPMILFIEPIVISGSTGAAQVIIHWRARIVANDNANTTGSLRLVVDTGQVNATHGHLPNTSPVDLAQLGKRDERGGWTIGGESPVNVPMRGHYGFGLYGVGPGLRVAWAAASVTMKTR